MDKINYRLATGVASITSEDSMSAVELSTRTVRKMNECVDVINELYEKIHVVMDTLGLTVEDEELTINLMDTLEQIKLNTAELSKRTSSFYNMNTMSSLELAGCTAKHVNECAKIINELTKSVEELATKVSTKVEGEELIINTEVI